MRECTLSLFSNEHIISTHHIRNDVHAKYNTIIPELSIMNICVWIKVPETLPKFEFNTMLGPGLVKRT